MLDTSTKLQLLAERFKSKSESMYVESMKDALGNVIAKLAKTEGQSEIKRLNSIKRFIEEEIGTLYESIKPTLAEDMQGFAKVQHEVMFNGLNAETGVGYAFGALPKETIKEIINMDSIILMNEKGYTLNEMFATASNAQIDRYKQIISAGLAENAGYSAITKRLKDTNAVGTTTLQAIVHTAVSSARDKANVNVYKKFDKYIDYFESTAVLDSRTSFICASLDGKKYRMPYNEIPSRPPRHPRCRSVLTPRSDSFKTNTTRQQNGDSKGQISSNVKFPEWFGKQSSQFQLDYLGKARYDLYKSGKMEFKQFVDVKSGKLFSLDEISGIMKPKYSSFIQQKIDKKLRSIELARADMIENQGYTNETFEKYLLTDSERKLLKGDYSDIIKQYEEQEKNSKEVESIFIKKTSKDFRKIFNKYGHAENYTFSDSDDIAFLSSGTDITISKTVDFRVFKHEYGHFVDASMGNRSMGKDFIEAFYKDSKLKQNGFYYDTDDFDNWLSSTLHDASRTEKFSDFSSGQICDIIDAMHNGKPSSGQGLFGFSGHGEEYYTGKHGESLKMAEAFAELFEMKDTSDYIKLKDHFPNMVELFDKIYNEEILK